MGIAQDDAPPVHRPAHSGAGPRLEARRGARLDTAAARVLDDGGREGVLAGALERGGQAKDLVLRVARQRHDGREARLPLRQGAGLVHHQGIDLLKALQGLGVADQDPGGGAPPGGDHDRHRRRQAEGARAGDDQHGHGADYGVRQTRLRPEQLPGEGRQRGDHDDDRHEPARYDVGETLDRCPAALRLADHPNDSGQKGVGPDTLGAHHQAARAVDGAAENAFARSLLHRDRLSRHHRLVHRAVTLEDDAVHRNLLAGPDPQAVAGPDAVERDILFAPVLVQTSGGRRRELQERPDGAAGPAASPQLDHLAEQHQHGDRRGGLEVDPDPALLTAQRRGEDPGKKRHGEAVGIGDAGTQGDEREHVEAAVPDRRPAALEERSAAVKDDGRRQGKLNPVEKTMRRDRPAGGTRQHSGHGN